MKKPDEVFILKVAMIILIWVAFFIGMAWQRVFIDAPKQKYEQRVHAAYQQGRYDGKQEVLNVF